ncbi:MAG: hypothetical protein Q4A15_01000 [Prevotellaceae bacterium]|nr:hypothetical protein [Prevotellaceae bacterium]
MEKMSELRKCVQSILRVEMCDIWIEEMPINMCWELRIRFTFPNKFFRFSITDEVLKKYETETIALNVRKFIEEEINNG